MPDPIPLPMQRLPKQTLHHVWAPKLGRPLMLNSARQLQLWAMLEANPEVSRYCERPSELPDADGPVAANFWALHRGRPTWLMVGGAEQTQASVSDALHNDAIVRVSGEELDRHRIWIQNWLALLPYLSYAAALDLRSLRVQVAAFFEHGATLGEAERHFAAIDGTLVRTAAIYALHRGQLFSPDLLVSSWTESMRIYRHRDPHCEHNR